MIQTLEATKRVPARASAAGQVVSWSVEAGQTVGKGDEIGIFEDEYGPLSITAPESGIVGRGIAEGKQVEKGAPLIFIEPTQALSESHHASEVYGDLSSSHASQHPRGAARAPIAPQTTPARQDDADPAILEELLSDRQLLPVDASDEEATGSDGKRRRSTLPPHIEELTLTRVPEPIRRPPVTPKGSEPRTKAKVYRVTPDQERLVKKLAKKVNAEEHAPEGPEVTESELIRMAIEMILDLPKPALMAMVRENRQREHEGQYGTGWPRPQKPKGKK